MDNQYNQILIEFRKKLADRLNEIKQNTSDPAIQKQKTDEILFEVTKEATNKVSELYQHNMAALEKQIQEIQKKLRKDAEIHHQKQLEEIRQKISNQ